MSSSLHLEAWEFTEESWVSGARDDERAEDGHGEHQEGEGPCPNPLRTYP